MASRHLVGEELLPSDPVSVISEWITENKLPEFAFGCLRRSVRVDTVIYVGLQVVQDLHHAAPVTVLLHALVIMASLNGKLLITQIINALEDRSHPFRNGNGRILAHHARLLTDLRFERADRKW